MEMIEKKNFSTARSNFKAVFDTVAVKQKPLIVNRYSEEVFMIARDIQKELLSCYTVAAEELPEADGSLTIAVDELDIAVNGQTKADAVKELIEEFKVYAEDYMDRINLFLSAPNRRAHFPFILRIMLADNDEDLLRLVRWSNASTV